MYINWPYKSNIVSDEVKSTMNESLVSVTFYGNLSDVWVILRTGRWFVLFFSFLFQLSSVLIIILIVIGFNVVATGGIAFQVVISDLGTSYSK